MNQELKQVFTRRLSQCNRAELVVIIYDIYFAHTKCAKEQYQVQDWNGYKFSLQKASESQSELIRALDMRIEMSGNLRIIYDYCRRLIYRAIAEQKLEYIDESDMLMEKLRKAFEEVAKQDASEPLMKNTQNVYAGYTYSKGTLNENYDLEANRGFFV